MFIASKFLQRHLWQSVAASARGQQRDDWQEKKTFVIDGGWQQHNNYI